MREAWRWFGPFDAISLPEVAQTGASAVVTALHEIPYGEVWPVDTIRERQALVADAAGSDLTWEVVESLPVHEDIKHGTGNLDRLFANYRQSMANLAECGITTICYNFMPVVDWTRTDLDVPGRGGAKALGFSEAKMAGFEICILKRDGAEYDYAPEVCAQGRAWFQASDERERETLLQTLMAGLPGAYDRYDVPGLEAVLKKWQGFGRDDLRASYGRFLDEVVPAAEDLGIRLGVHPDDPPRPVFGLPRVVSTADDAAWILDRVDSPANGLTFCSGAFGAHPGNDIVGMAGRFADRIQFLHLRNVSKDPDGSFQEADHLDGDTDMVELLRVVLAEEHRRKETGRQDWNIPFRPDHGRELCPDIGRGAHPGYPFVGRLRGLAELRGAIAGLRSAGKHSGSMR